QLVSRTRQRRIVANYTGGSLLAGRANDGLLPTTRGGPYHVRTRACAASTGCRAAADRGRSEVMRTRDRQSPLGGTCRRLALADGHRTTGFTGNVPAAQPGIPERGCVSFRSRCRLRRAETFSRRSRAAPPPGSRPGAERGGRERP